MVKKPDFFILAGPNGAGKTTNGHLFVPPAISIFNGDQVLADLIEKYPAVEPSRLHGGVAKALEDARDAALAVKGDFAFESNYSSDMATEMTQLFKEAGYNATLIYFGLDSLKVSAARVNERKLLGGHDVSPEAMQYNFVEGIERVNKDLKLFDTILFVDTLRKNARIIALIQIGSGQQINLIENISWYDRHFKGTVEALQIKRRRLVSEIRQAPNNPGKRFRL